MKLSYIIASLPDEKTHFMLSCLAMANIGNIVPKIALRNGTMP